MAMNAHGYRRVMADVDVLLTLEGLDAAGKKAWGAYARTVKIDTKVDPSEWSAESRAEAMAWLEVG